MAYSFLKGRQGAFPLKPTGATPLKSMIFFTIPFWLLTPSSASGLFFNEISQPSAVTRPSQTPDASAPEKHSPLEIKPRLTPPPSRPRAQNDKAKRIEGKREPEAVAKRNVNRNANRDGGEIKEGSTEGCLAITAVSDRDGDFARNRQTLSSLGLCIKQENFSEGALRWKLQIIQNRANPGRYFWFVPHGNENVAFDTAVHAVMNYGGTVVAIETGGSRYNGSQDPNRNFDTGSGRRCPQQVASSRIFTSQVLKWRAANAPVIALHSNERGHGGDGAGGAGGISMLKRLPNTTPFPAVKPIVTRSPSDSMVFVASTSAPTAGSGLMNFVAALNKVGLNVMYEAVTPKINDCSFSHFAALTGLRPYINVEVAHGDGEGQRRMLKIVLPMLGN